MFGDYQLCFKMGERKGEMRVFDELNIDTGFNKFMHGPLLKPSKQIY